MVIGVRPSVEYLLLHVNICDGTDVMINKDFLLLLKCFFATVVISAVDIFIDILDIYFFFNVGIT